MKLFTIILNWNGKNDTLECLESLSKTKGLEFEHKIVLIDNASTDGSVEAINEQYPGIEVIINSENLGFAKANNEAIEWARKGGADYVILLNNDTTVDPGTFKLLVSGALIDPKVGAVMPLIKYYDSKRIWYAGGKIIRPFGRVQSLTQTPSPNPYTTELFSGCAVLLPVKVLEKVGTLDERYFMYLEDADLALRLQRMGLNVWVVPQAVVYHKVSRSSGGPVSPNPIYYQIRNNLLLIRDHSENLLVKLLGYFYMLVLTIKIVLNTFIYRLPNKVAIYRALIQAWQDFLLSRFGKRR